MMQTPTARHERHHWLQSLTETLKRTLIFLVLLLALLALISGVAWLYHNAFGTLGGNA